MLGHRTAGACSEVSFPIVKQTNRNRLIANTFSNVENCQVNFNGPLHPEHPADFALQSLPRTLPSDALSHSFYPSETLFSCSRMVLAHRRYPSATPPQHPSASSPFQLSRQKPLNHPLYAPVKTPPPSVPSRVMLKTDAVIHTSPTHKDRLRPRRLVVRGPMAIGQTSTETFTERRLPSQKAPPQFE